MGESPSSLVLNASPLPLRPPPSGGTASDLRAALRAAGLGTVGSRPEAVAARLAPATAESGSRPEAARDADSADDSGTRPDGARCMSADARQQARPAQTCVAIGRHEHHACDRHECRR